MSIASLLFLPTTTFSKLSLRVFFKLKIGNVNNFQDGFYYIKITDFDNE